MQCPVWVLISGCMSGPAFGQSDFLSSSKAIDLQISGGCSLLVKDILQSAYRASSDRTLARDILAYTMIRHTWTEMSHDMTKPTK